MIPLAKKFLFEKFVKSSGPPSYIYIALEFLHRSCSNSLSTAVLKRTLNFSHISGSKVYSRILAMQGGQFQQELKYFSLKRSLNAFLAKFEALFFILEIQQRS